MSLLDDLNDAATPQKPGCKLCAALDDMAVSESSQVRTLLAGKMISQRALARVLTKNGYSVGATAIGKHVIEEHA